MLLYRKCRELEGPQSAGWWSLCICGYLLVFFFLGWMAYGQFEFSLNPALWGMCFLIGLAATAVWISFVDGPKPIILMVLRLALAILRIVPSLTKALVILAIAGVALIFVTTVLLQLFYHDTPASELPFVLWAGFPDVYLDAMRVIGLILGSLLFILVIMGSGSGGETIDVAEYHRLKADEFARLWS